MRWTEILKKNKKKPKKLKKSTNKEISQQTSNNLNTIFTCQGILKVRIFPYYVTDAQD